MISSAAHTSPRSWMATKPIEKPTVKESLQKLTNGQNFQKKIRISTPKIGL